MSVETISTDRGPVSVARQAGEALLRVSWPVDNRAGELAVPFLTELAAEWRPKRKAWFLKAGDLETFRERIASVELAVTEPFTRLFSRFVCREQTTWRVLSELNKLRLEAGLDHRPPPTTRVIGLTGEPGHPGSAFHVRRER